MRKVLKYVSIALMSLIEQLKENSSRRDEEANIALAQSIAKDGDAESLDQVVAQLNTSKLQNDCIKIIYEVAERKPELVTGHLNLMFELLKHKNIRLVWGAMTAIDAMTTSKQSEILDRLGEAGTAAGRGSVIARDHFVNILIQLSTTAPDTVLPLLIDQFRECPPNQLPMYAENAWSVFGTRRDEFIEILSNRIGEMKTDSKKKRIEKVLMKLHKLRVDRLS